jgi:hypothetical protein
MAAKTLFLHNPEPLIQVVARVVALLVTKAQFAAAPALSL